ncbi:MAG: hypothetical protein JWO67_3124 [Streptosporangiaceae bacterium]|nr:hypothetical protein [Streptosporangiaceae bacterium]
MPTTPSVSPDWITVDPPAAVIPRRDELAALAGWEIRNSADRWRIRTRESYLQQRPTLLTTRWIGSAGFEHLTSLPAQPPEVSAQPSILIDAALPGLQSDDNMPSLVAEFQLLFLRTPTHELPRAMKRFFDRRATAKMPGSELLTVDVAPELSGRYTAAKFLLTAQVAPSQLTEGTHLPAGQALATSYALGAQVFTAPALLALAPYVYGVPGVRARAAAVWLFGQAVPGLQWPGSNLVEALGTSDDRFTGPRQRNNRTPPAATPEQLKQFVTWWVGQVNKILAVASEPLNFPDASGMYDPLRHWQFLASIERLFRDVAEVLVHTEHNETARLRAAYDALDTLHGMGRGGFDALVRPSRAAKALRRLEQDLGPSIAAVALPACRRAVTAMDAVKDGFIRTSRHYTPNGLADLPGKTGPVTKTWDEATALYLRRDRNSAHSFLGLEDWEKALVFSHDGRLPRDVAGLAFLYLLDLIAHPEHLATQLRR